MCSPKFDFFAKYLGRKQLYETLKKVTNEAEKQTVQKAWLYKDLNFQNTFRRRASFKFAQLNT